MNEGETVSRNWAGSLSGIVNFPLLAMLIAIAAFFAAVSLAVIAHSFLPPMPYGLKPAADAVIAVGLALIAYKLVIRRLGEPPRDDLRSRCAVRNLALGLAMGSVLFSVVVGIAAALGSYRILGCCSAQELASDLFIASVMPGFMEELFFRGILFRWLEEFAGSWVALAVTSALFGLVHILNPNATWFSSFAIAVEAGILLGGLYMLTRSLWAPIGLHAAWNFTQGFIFDVPVSGHAENGLVTARLSGPELLSGGRFGLEASLIALIVASAAGVCLLVLAVRRGQLIQPRWVRRRALKAT
jgi:membrane protease YdiL (CAAX protease family)